jgi:hypothetical protein
VAGLDSRYREHLEDQTGEALHGLCVASQQKGMFKGGAVAIGVTDSHLLIQPLDRRGSPDGTLRSIAPDQITSAKAGPAGGEWFNVDAVVLDHAAVRLEIKTTDGEKLKLMLMRGEGKLLGRLGGGEAQREGVQALGRWFEGIGA